MRLQVLPLLVITLLWVCSCPDPRVGEVENPTQLQPYANPFDASDSRWSAQPKRDKPQEVVVSLDGGKAYVSLPGTVDDPSHAVAVVDAASGELMRRIDVGAGVSGLALHPEGRWLVALSRFTNYVSVIDTSTDEVRHRPPVAFYATEAVFSPSGERLFVTNRWRDELIVFDVEPLEGGLAIEEAGRIPTGQNPRDVAVADDGQTVAVGALTGMDVTLIDATELTAFARVDLGAPVNGLAFADGFVVAATLSASTHHLATAGPDTNHDGVPGDGTPNVNFQDLQNEIAIIRADEGQVVHRYTSDTICCRDYRDVDPADLSREGGLLPPSSTWIVAGALPEQVVVTPGPARAVFVSYSASNQVQKFGINAEDGSLTPVRTFSTDGHGPHGLAVSGERLFVVNRLSESLSAFDEGEAVPAWTSTVGDPGEHAFPATDVEIGELINDVTSFYAIDGDQSCAHCHREGGNIDKAFSMPLTKYAGLGARMTMAYRGSADTRPWFFESAMDESNFRPVINEFARIENFCCSDYTLWSGGAPVECEIGGLPECAEDGPGSVDGFSANRGDGVTTHPRATAFPSRDLFYLDASQTLMGRQRSFGDGLFYENPVTLERSDVPLDFDGVTRALGMFLMASPRLLPNPNHADSVAAARGRAIFNSGSTGCSVCHPAPTFAVSTDVNPSDLPLRFGPVVSPNRDNAGNNLDLFSPGFSDVFPAAELESCEEVCGAEQCLMDGDSCDTYRQVKFGVPSLRGIWDRATGMLHDGRARGLREVVCTPGHPALLAGEIGYNELDGIVDSHGGTSHLSVDEVEDLISYMLTL